MKTISVIIFYNHPALDARFLKAQFMAEVIIATDHLRNIIIPVGRVNYKKIKPRLLKAGLGKEPMAKLTRRKFKVCF